MYTPIKKPAHDTARRQPRREPHRHPSVAQGSQLPCHARITAALRIRLPPTPHPQHPKRLASTHQKGLRRAPCRQAAAAHLQLDQPQRRSRARWPRRGAARPAQPAHVRVLLGRIRRRRPLRPARHRHRHPQPAALSHRTTGLRHHRHRRAGQPEPAVRRRLPRSRRQVLRDRRHPTRRMQQLPVVHRARIMQRPEQHRERHRHPQRHHSRLPLRVPSLRLAHLRRSRTGRI